MNTALTTSASSATPGNLPVDQYMTAVGQSARTAATLMAAASTAAKNQALLVLGRLIRDNAATLQADNQVDLDKAKANGLSEPMIDRLSLNAKVIETMAQS